jgi:nucleotide-binding universal stress UspA family protein
VLQLTFQLTLRSLSSTEIAEDHELVKRLKILYDRLDAGTTPASVLLPWLPTPAMIKKLLATKDIYKIITKAIQERKASGKARDDTLQMLLDYEDDELMVVGVSVISGNSQAHGSTSVHLRHAICTVYHGTIDSRSKSNWNDR